MSDKFPFSFEEMEESENSSCKILRIKLIFRKKKQDKPEKKRYIYNITMKNCSVIFFFLFLDFSSI